MPRFLSDYQAAKAQGALWTPRNLTTAVYFWGEAWTRENQTYNASTGAVSQVADILGSGRLLTGPSGVEPTLDWEKKCWTMPQSTTQRFLTGGTVWPATPWDAYLVYTSPSAYTFYRAFLVTGPSIFNPIYPLVGNHTNNDLATFVSAYVQYDSFTWLPGRSGLIFVRSASASSFSAALDGDSTLSGSTNTFSDTTLLGVGNETSTVSPVNAGIGDLHAFMLTAPGSASDKARIEGYLSWAADMARGGSWTFRDKLGPAHAYRNAPPIIGQ